MTYVFITKNNRNSPVCLFYCFLFYSDTTFTAHSQSHLQKIKYRNIVIDLGNGIKTNAQLTYPAVGGGGNWIFPGVLLITGSGAEDMNETAGYIRIDNNKTE